MNVKMTTIMKNQILLILMMTLSLTANCQFRLTSEGFVDTKDKDNKYIVLYFPDLTQSQISSRVNLLLSSMSISPKDRISKVDSSLIVINEFCEKCIFEQAYYDMNYNIQFRFKPGKVRIESPTFELIASRDNHVKVVLVTRDALDLLTIGIYNKSGKLKYPQFINTIETYFNDYIQQLAESINKNSEDENW